MKQNRLLLTLLLAATLFPKAIHAELIISGPVFQAARGTSGDFEIYLNNVGTASVQIGSFSFDISTADPSVDFLFAQEPPPSVGAYIYSENSFAIANGLPLATKTGQEMLVSDSPNNGMAAVLVPDRPVSLGEVFYSIAPSASPGVVPVTFSSLGTSLADQFGNPSTFTALNGEITITLHPPPVIPEPEHLTPVAALFALLFLSWRRHCRHIQR